MENTFHCRIQTPDAVIYDGEVIVMQIATDDGVIELHPHHTHLVTTVSASRALVTDNEGVSHHIILRHGVIEFDTTTNACEGLFFYASLASTLRQETLLEYRDRILKDLEGKDTLSRYHVDFLTSESMSIEKLLTITEEHPQ